MDHITETNSDDIAIAAAIRTLFNTPPIAAVLRKVIASEINGEVSSGAFKFDPKVIATVVDPKEVADRIELKEVADHIELSELASEIDLRDLVEHISIDTDDIVENLNYRRLAEAIIRQINTTRY